MTGTGLFISHASQDHAVVARIVAYLEERGVPCWIAGRDIPPQSIYAEAIAHGIRDCAACAVVLSAATNTSDAVKRELELASHYKKAFIPIRIDATELSPGFDYYLRNTQWLDYRRDGERALQRIVVHMSDGAANKGLSSESASLAHGRSRAQQGSKLPRSTSGIGAVLLGGLIASVLSASLFYFVLVPEMGWMSVVTLFDFVGGQWALGMFDSEIATRLLHLATHLTLTTIFAGAFVLASARLKTLTKHPILWGVIFVLALDAMIVALGLIVSEVFHTLPFPWQFWLPVLAVLGFTRWALLALVLHPVLVGIPIGLAARRRAVS